MSGGPGVVLDAVNVLQVPLGYYSLFWAPEPILPKAHLAKFSELRSRRHIQALSEDLQDRQVQSSYGT